MSGYRPQVLTNHDVILYACTIDYYTQVGLIQACRRSNGNYRLYGADALERLRLIRTYREQGLHLAAIQERLMVARAGGAEALQECLSEIQELVDQMVRKSAEIAESRPQLRAVAARDERARLAISRVASDLLHKALMLSGALASAVEEVGRSPIH